MQNKLTELVKKYREPIAYLFFGGLATLLNIVLYVLFKTLFGYEAANSWGNVADNVLCILFAYFTNRIWVFRSKAHGSAALREFGSFVACRLGTLVVDAAIMFVGGNLVGPALVPAACILPTSAARWPGTSCTAEAGRASAGRHCTVPA